jgi:hypothetical protein
MNRLHLRYLIFSLAATALMSIMVQLFVMTLLANNNQALAGAALVSGWWTNLIAAATVGILAGRRAAMGFTDPRIGKVAGAAVGVWVGVGAVIGLVISALALMAQVPNGEVRPGLIMVFGGISFAVGLIAAMIAGRETAHPSEAEEEA